MQKSWQDKVRLREIIDHNNLASRPARKSFICGLFPPDEGAILAMRLRRVLLSRIAGAAVTSMKIEGVASEWATEIPGVDAARCNVMDILLNVKGLRFKLSGRDTQRAVVDVKGPRELSAADLELGDGLELLSPSATIVEVEPGERFQMALTVRPGTGYLAADANDRVDRSAGEIAIDAIFSPVLRVNTATSLEEGGEMLTLEIEADAIEPEQALAMAVSILEQDQALALA